MKNKRMNVAVMIMAAGESKRFGSCKQLSQISDQHSLLSHAVEQAKNAQIGPVYVVTGRWHNEIERAQQDGKLKTAPLLYCSNWAEGLGSTIAYASAILAPKYDALLITLADQIALSSDDYVQLVNSTTTEHIVCSHYAGKRGVPAVFPACYFPLLSQLNGEHGARHILRNEQLPIQEVNLPHAKYDIDTPSALAELSTLT